MMSVLAPAVDVAEQFSLTYIGDFSPAAHDLCEARVRVDDRISEFGSMSVSALARGCMCELNDYRHGDVCDNPYSMELLRRATVLRDPLAWEVLQQCLSATVLQHCCSTSQARGSRSTVARRSSSIEYGLSHTSPWR